MFSPFHDVGVHGLRVYAYTGKKVAATMFNVYPPRTPRRFRYTVYGNPVYGRRCGIRCFL